MRLTVVIFGEAGSEAFILLALCNLCALNVSVTP
jgi:hypothetical protein